MAFDPSTAKPLKQVSAPANKGSFDASTAKPVQATRPEPEGTILNPIANALGFGWTDEATAGLLSAYGAMSGDIEPNKVGEAYEAIRSGIEEERKAYAESDPVKSIGAEVITAGAVGLPKIMETLATKGLIGAGTVAGLEGLLYGAGEGGEPIQEGENIAFGVEAPMDISGRAVGGAQTAALSVPFGVAGAKVAQAGADKITDIARRRKLTREGVEASETAPYALRTPSRQETPETVQTGDATEDIVQNLPKPPEGVMGVAREFSPLRPKVDKPKVFQRAQYQQVTPATITNIREANNPTRKKMEQVTKIHWAAVNGSTKTDPYMVIGDEFTKRLDVVKAKQKEALDLQQGARKTLVDVKDERLAPIADNVANDFISGLEGKRIRLDEEGNLDFSSVGDASPLKKAANRSALNKVWNQFQKARTADDLHELRRDIDKMVRFEKGGVTGGVDTDTEAVLKQMRSSIRENLNTVSPQYAEANRIMSQNLDAIGLLESAMPRLKKKYDFNDPNQLEAATNHIGSQLRKLESNYANADELALAVDTFDDLAKQYGADFPVDIRRLNKHLAEIKLRLGEGKAGGFQAKTEAGTRRGMRMPTGENMIEGILEKSLNPVKGISDEKAYESILESINEMNRRTK